MRTGVGFSYPREILQAIPIEYWPKVVPFRASVSMALMYPFGAPRFRVGPRNVDVTGVNLSVLLCSPNRRVVEKRYHGFDLSGATQVGVDNRAHRTSRDMDMGEY